MILMAFEFLAVSICCAVFFSLGFQCGMAKQKTIDHSFSGGGSVKSEFEDDLSKILSYTGDISRD